MITIVAEDPTVARGNLTRTVTPEATASRRVAKARALQEVQHDDHAVKHLN